MLFETVKSSKFSVLKLKSTCDTLRSEVSARTSEIAVLQARPPVIAYGSSQSDADTVVRELDDLASFSVFSRITPVVLRMILPTFAFRLGQVAS